MEANTISLKTFTSGLMSIVLIETSYRLATSVRIAASLPALGFIRCLESIVLVIIVLAIEKNTAAIGLARVKITYGLMRGLIWSACFGIAAGVLYLALLLAGINALNLLTGPKPAHWQDMLIFLVVGSVIGPISEEIFFRGIIYGFFRRWGFAAAVLLSTAVFVFSHPVSGSLPVTQLVGGLVFAVAYEKEQNLMVPVTIHCLGNLAIFSLMFFS